MLKNTTTGLIYIGASCDDLNARLRRHRHDAYINRGCTSRHLFENNGEVTIEVLDYCPCDNVRQLSEREAYYIRLFKEGCGKQCVNIQIPGRTFQQWYQDSKEARGVRSKAYREANKDTHNAYKRAWREIQQLVSCPCGSTYKHGGKPRHLKTKLHQSYIQATNNNIA